MQALPPVWRGGRKKFYTCFKKASKKRQLLSCPQRGGARKEVSMQRDISQQKIVLQPLSSSDDFHSYLACYKLTWVEVARASGVPVLTVWSIDHGLTVESTQAALVRE